MKNWNLFRRIAKIAAWVGAIYVVASGPLAGILSHLPWIEEGTRSSIVVYHLFVYYPLVIASSWIGCAKILFGYWTFCGWICPVGMPA